MAHPVRVLPVDAVLQVESGETVFAAAERQGWRWPSICRGDGECGICFVLVERGGEHLTPMSGEERSRLRLGMAATRAEARLACATRVHGGPIVVRRKGARPTNPEPEERTP